jgi:hypothetical protein
MKASWLSSAKSWGMRGLKDRNGIRKKEKERQKERKKEEKKERGKKKNVSLKYQIK